ncbi:MAG: iron-regulated protein [Cellvibrionaceae bacterium]|nr:iron-regulated protein [Cellvibrionaceae bacterium]|tara:strand:- start:6834 stop:8411 length:1578 start_codon:yes stop_codon:yes gene_type:complete
MKFRHSMTWLHTWAGLVFGALLYLMFVTGSAGYFDLEITRWMQPEIPVQQSSFDAPALLPKAEQRLQQLAPHADHVYIELPEGRSPYFMIWWHNPKGVDNPGWHSEVLDPSSGAPVAVRNTAGGEFLYRLHYVLHYIPKGLAYWLTSLAAMFMLVAIVTGVVIHRRIFKDFFTFRRSHRQTAWLDMHNLMGVLPLPFHLMITYSGLILLMFSTMLPVPASSFGLNPEKLRQVYDTVFSDGDHARGNGMAASSLPLVELYNLDHSKHSGATIAYLAVENWGDEKAVVEVGKLAQTGLEPFDVSYYQAVNGESFKGESQLRDRFLSLSFYHVIEHLHEGLFAGPWLRWLYFLSGLMGAGMVATGSIFWAIKRRHAHEKAGLDSRAVRWVENLNVGVIAGLPIAIGGYFLTSRLLSATLENRVDWEMHSLFVVWFVALLHPFLPRRQCDLSQLWAEQFKAAAVVYASIPFVNWMTSEVHLGMSLKYQDWTLVGFDFFALVLAACCAYFVHKINGRQRVSTMETVGVSQ